MTNTALSLVLASGNPNKKVELDAALSPLGILVRTLDDPPDPEETGTTFVENAWIKATEFAQQCGAPCLSDDSGLEVDALAGAPGVYSARYAVPRPGESRYEANNRKLLAELAETQNRQARFRCALAIAVPRGCSLEWRGRPILEHLSSRIPSDAVRLEDNEAIGVGFFGAAEGTILQSLQGGGGFGYDPLFLSADLGVSFAEASLAEKQGVSHRGRAIARMVDYLMGLG